MGRHTPEAVGDYVGGPNHVLPTGRRARFSSGLSVADFMKRTSFLACSPESRGKIGPAAVSLARAEGLPAPARPVAIRLGVRSLRNPAVKAGPPGGRLAAPDYEHTTRES